VEAWLHRFLSSALGNGQGHNPGKVVLVPIEWEAGWAPEPVLTLCTRDYIFRLTRTSVLVDTCGVCNRRNLFAYDVYKICNTVSCPLQPTTDQAFLSTYSESPDFKNALFLVAYIFGRQTHINGPTVYSFATQTLLTGTITLGS